MYRGKGKNEASGSKSKENRGESMRTSSKYTSGIVQAAVVCVAALIIFRTISDAGIVLYTLHPTLMAVGYLILMTQGILAMSGLSLLADGFSHSKRVSAHWVFQSLGLLLITVAQSSIYINKDLNGYPHYSSVHSWCGLVTYLLTLGATCGGVATKFAPKLKLKPAQMKMVHGFFGSVVFVFACGTICVGLNQVWTEEKDAEIKLSSFLVIFIGCFYTVHRSLESAIRRAVNA